MLRTRFQRSAAIFAAVIFSGTNLAGEDLFIEIPLQNGNFDVAVEPWATNPGDCLLDATDGNVSGPGSASCMTVIEGDANSVSLSQCVSLQGYPGGFYRFDYSYRVVDNVGFPAVTMIVFGTPDCSEFGQFVGQLSPPFGTPTNDWRPGRFVTSAPIAGGGSIQLGWRASAPFGSIDLGEIAFDDARLFYDELIFEDDFEEEL